MSSVNVETVEIQDKDEVSDVKETETVKFSSTTSQSYSNENHAIEV